jgi:hypothetical protein
MNIEPKITSMKELKDMMARENFGISISMAQEKGICIECKEPALEKCYSEAGRKEYSISGLCEQCFDIICKERF